MNAVSSGKKVFQAATLVMSLLLAVGCASKSSVSGLDRASQNHRALSDTDERLAKAQNELSSFQGTLKDLQSSMATTKNGYSTEQANRVLARLSLRLDQTQLDLKELKAQNEDAKKDLDSRLNQAADANQRLIRQGN